MEELRDRTGKPLKEKYPEIGEFLSTLLDRQRAEAEAADRSPEILQFDELYVHREALPAMVTEELDSAADACRGAVEAKWRSDLEQGNFSEETMQSDQAFAEMLDELARTRSALLSRVLRKPHTLHLLITELAEQDPGMLKRHEALFEAPDRPVFRRADQLLGLDRQEIIGRIVSGMSLFRRFLLRRRFRLRREAPAKAAATRPQPKARPPEDRGQAALQPATPAPGAAAPREQQAPASASGRAAPGVGKGRRPGRAGPKTVPVKRRARPGPRTMDEALDRLKQAMVKKKQV
jgi:hypothetical protein